MITKAFTTALLSTLLLCSTSVMANKHKPNKHAYKHHEQARVIHVEPHYVQTGANKSYQQCRPTKHHDNHHSASSPSYTTAIAGAVVGGLIGSQFGQGNGKTLAAVTGTLIGGAAGYHYQNYDNQQHQRNTYKQSCYAKPTKHHRKQQGYDVTYRYQGQTHYTHLNYRPGKYIPIQGNHRSSKRYY